MRSRPPARAIGDEGQCRRCGRWLDLSGRAGYGARVTLDDGRAQVDPATLPQNMGLMQKIDAQIAAAEHRRARQRELAARLAAAVPDAVSGIEAQVLERDGFHAREEDLRGGISAALRARGELVMTEAKLAVPGWTKTLGGFDIAMVADDSLVVAETKWADGNIYESLWDIFKLASALAIDRVDAAVAIYGAPAKHWERPDSCARLFEDRELACWSLIRHFPKEWAICLAGSSARPLAIPPFVDVALVGREQTEVAGKLWEVRAVRVETEQAHAALENGWPDGAPPESAKPIAW